MSKASLRRIAIIIKREYLQRVFTRSFAGSTLLIPVLLVGMVAVPAYLIGVRPKPAAPGVLEHAATIGGAVAAGILLYILFVSLFSWGAIVMRAVLDEKQSRVLEILLCFASPNELMAGKILGIGALALTQVMVWIAMAGAFVATSALLRGVLVALHLGSAALAYFIVFDVLGYLLYSAMFCAIGAAFNSVDEAQQWTLILVLPLIATGMLLTTVLTRPDSPASVTFSIVPFTSPALMYARVMIGHPPVWQVAFSFAALIAAIVIAIRICARIYRVGILMYGRRPGAREILRWMRYAS